MRPWLPEPELWVLLDRRARRPVREQALRLEKLDRAPARLARVARADIPYTSLVKRLRWRNHSPQPAKDV